MLTTEPKVRPALPPPPPLPWCRPNTNDPLCPTEPQVLPVAAVRQVVPAVRGAELAVLLRHQERPEPGAAQHAGRQAAGSEPEPEPQHEHEPQPEPEPTHWTGTLPKHNVCLPLKISYYT